MLLIHTYYRPLYTIQVFESQMISPNLITIDKSQDYLVEYPAPK